jgi:hypothetical protein
MAGFAYLASYAEVFGRLSEIGRQLTRVPGLASAHGVIEVRQRGKARHYTDGHGHPPSDEPSWMFIVTGERVGWGTQRPSCSGKTWSENA